MKNIISQVCNRNSFIQHSLPTWLDSDCDSITIVDMSTNESAIDVVQSITDDPRITVAQCNDGTPYRIAIARNAAARMVDDDVLYIFDIDTILLERTLPELATGTALRGSIHCGQLNGITIVSHLDFKKVNGYNERLYGWGYEDDDLAFRLQLAGVRLESLSNIFKHYDHPNEMRTINYTIKNEDDSWYANARSSLKDPWTTKDEQKRVQFTIHRGSI